MRTRKQVVRGHQVMVSATDFGTVPVSKDALRVQ